MDSHLQCTICRKTFTQKSSLVRHSKRCTPGPAPSLRQKSCRACTSSKTKCDLQRPRCARCEQRDTPCEYIVPMTRGSSARLSHEEDEVLGLEEQVIVTLDGTITSADMMPLSLASVPLPMLRHDMDFDINFPVTSFDFTHPLYAITSPEFDMSAGKDTFPSIWEHPISTSLAGRTPMLASLDTDQALNTAMMILSTPSDHDINPNSDWLLWSKGNTHDTPPLVRHSMETLLRVMKTWPRTLAKGFQTPGVLHHTHTDHDTILQPMIDCIAIARMWSNQTEDASPIVYQAIIQQMGNIFSTYRQLDEHKLLSSLQALLIYTIMVMYPARSQISVSLVDPAIFLRLQKVVSYIAKTGLMLTEERDNERPNWETWIHITAKRRAVFSLYLLHWSYAVYHGLESFACGQLGFTPAPAPKFLWQAVTKERWEALYDGWLGQWGEHPYMMREFAAIQAGISLDPRTEIWLEDADELGVLFFSIGTTTHPHFGWWQC